MILIDPKTSLNERNCVNPFIICANQYKLLFQANEKKHQNENLYHLVPNEINFNRIGTIDGNDMMCHPFSFQQEENKASNNLYLRFFNIVVDIFKNLSFLFTDNAPVFVLKI